MLWILCFLTFFSSTAKVFFSPSFFPSQHQYPCTLHNIHTNNLVSISLYFSWGSYNNLHTHTQGLTKNSLIHIFLCILIFTFKNTPRKSFRLAEKALSDALYWHSVWKYHALVTPFLIDGDPRCFWVFIIRNNTTINILKPMSFIWVPLFLWESPPRRLLGLKIYGLLILIDLARLLSNTVSLLTIHKSIALEVLLILKYKILHFYPNKFQMLNTLKGWIIADN